MEPARSPKGNAQENSPELDAIIREANRGLPSTRKPQLAATPPPVAPPRAKQPARREASAADVAGVKYEIDRRRRFVGPTSLQGSGFEWTPLRITALALGAVAALLWVRLLAFGDTASAPTFDPAYSEASMRWAIVLTSRRVDDFRRANQRTPNAFSEIGELPSPLISYERVSVDRYRLTGATSNGPLVLDSMGSPSDFLGNSLETLRASSAVKP